MGYFVKILKVFYMKKIVILIVALLATSSLLAQPKWAIKVSGSIGGSINTGTYDTYYDGNYWHNYDRWDDIYDNSKMFYDAGIGFRFHIIKWLYLGVDVNYSKLENKYDPYHFYFRGDGDLSLLNKTLTLEGVSVAFVTGFAYHNNSRFYPFAEIGLMPYFTINDDFHDRSAYFGTNFKIGGGVKLTEMLALELAFTSTMFYKSGHNRYYYGGRYYYSDHTLEVNSGIGANLGLVINF